jgi:Flp pilus assembly protein TadG
MYHMLSAHHRRTRRTRRRGVTLIEFAFVLPILLFLMAFMVDMGRLLMVSHAMQEATYRSARAGAIAGGANISAGANQSVSREAFDRALSEIPGADQVSGPPTLLVDSGGLCTKEGQNQFVTVSTTYNVRLLTPGLGTLLTIAGGDGAQVSASYNLKATSLSRCEVLGVG